MSRRAGVLALVTGVLSSLLMAAVASAQLPADPVPYYETIDLELVTFEGSVSARLKVLGREYSARLTQNRALIRNLPAATRTAVADIAIWSGRLDSIQGSWISLVQRGDFLSGSFFDGAQIYAIGPYAFLEDRLAAPNPLDAGSLIVYPLQWPGSGLVDAVVPLPPEIGVSPSKENRSAVSPVEKPVLAQGREVEIAVAVDADLWAQYQDLEGLVEAIVFSAMATADAIFVHQVGLHLTMSELRIFETEPDPFSATSIGGRIAEFQNFAGATPAFRDADLSYLFTGRTLSDSLAGYATIGGVCRRGTGVAIEHPFHPGVVTAHEIAHVFGVVHDEQTSCRTESPSYLMTSGVAISTTFSSCSIATLQSAIAREACFAPIPGSDLVLSMSDVPISVTGSQPFAVGVRLDSVGSYDSVAVELAIDSPAASFAGLESHPWPDWDNAMGPAPELDTYTDTSLWKLNRVPANGSLEFTALFRAAEAGAITIALDAWSLNDSDPGNNSVAATFDVLPAVHFEMAAVAVAPTLAVPNELVVVSVDIDNVGNVDANEVTIEIVERYELFEFVSASLPGAGSCTPVTGGGLLTCPIGTIPKSGTAHVEFGLRTLDPGPPGRFRSEPFSLTVAAAEMDTGTGTATAQLRMTNANADIGVTLSGPATVEVEDYFAFAMTIENRGPDAAEDIRLTFTNDWWGSAGEPAYCWEVDWWDSPTWSQCTIGRLEAGESIDLTISGWPFEAGSFVAQASVTAAASDPNPANDLASHDWTVTSPEPPEPPAPAPTPPEPPAPAPTPTPAVPQPPAAGGAASSGGGGGGAITPFWLLLLVLAGFAGGRGERDPWRPQRFGPG